MERNRLVSLIVLLIVAFLGLWALKALFAYIGPFVIAAIIAVGIDPLVNRIERSLHVSRGAAVLCTLVGVFGLAVLVITLSLIRLAFELIGFSSALPSYYQEVYSLGESVLGWMNQKISLLPPPFQDIIERQRLEVYGWVESLLYGALGLIYSIFQRLPGIVGTTFISFIATYFASRDWHRIMTLFEELAPRAWGESLRKMKADVIGSTIGLFKAQFTVMGLSALMTTVGLLIIKSEYAISLGLIAGILDIFPYMGPSVILGPWMLGAVVLGEYSLAAKLGALLAIVLLVRQMLEAKILGGRTGLHPLLALISIYVGVKVLGAAGAIFGPLGAILVRSLVRSFVPLSKGD